MVVVILLFRKIRQEKGNNDCNYIYKKKKKTIEFKGTSPSNLVILIIIKKINKKKK